MHQHKAITILITFDSNDWRECGHFLKGRFRENHDCISLYKILRKLYTKAQLEQTSHAMIKERHFHNITNKSFTNLYSKLTIKLEEYLAFSTLLMSQSDYQLTLLKAYTERGLYTIFDKKADLLENKIKEEENVALFDQYDLLKLNHLRYFSDNPIKAKKGHELISTLGEHNANFNNQYQQALTIADFHLKEISKFPPKDGKTTTASSYLTEVLHKLTELKTSPSKEHFASLYYLLTKESSKLSKELNSMILELLIHFAHKEIRRGDFSILDRLLDLYELGFEQELLLNNNRLTENRFVNLISTACAGGKYDRADKIITDYSNLLLEKTRDGAVQISKAHIMLYRGEYELLLDAIRDYSFSSLTQNLRRRIFLLCAIYKLYSTDISYIEVQIKNYKNYFYSIRNKISDTLFSSCMNFCKVIQMLSLIHI